MARSSPAPSAGVQKSDFFELDFGHLRGKEGEGKENEGEPPWTGWLSLIVMKINR
jgi:hypothetical protein